jgi:hypothetical protein
VSLEMMMIRKITLTAKRVVAILLREVMASKARKVNSLHPISA